MQYSEIEVHIYKESTRDPFKHIMDNPTFNRESLLYLACNDKMPFFTSEQPKRYKLWSCQKMSHALHYLLENILKRFGLK